MAIKVHGKKASGTPAQTQPAQTPPDQSAQPAQADLSQLGAGSNAPTEQQSAPQSAPATQQGPTPPPQAPAPATQAPGYQTPAPFLMTGTAQHTAVEQVKAVQDMRARLRGGAREFWLNPGEFARLYFLDGTLLSEGVFDTPMVATHMLQIGGSWARFVCNKQTEGHCLVCDSNADGSQPQTFQLFTVINTMPYVIQNGPRKGKTLPARLQLFAATLKVREKLMKRAQNHDGKLAGSLYTFTRNTKQDPRTGDDVEFLQEVPMQGVLQKYPMLGQRRNAKGEIEDAPTTVIDYAQSYPVLTNAELATMRPDLASMAGFTGAYSPQKPPSTGFQQQGFGADPTGDLDDEVPF